MTSILKNFPNWPAADRVHAFVTERTGGFSTGKFSSLNLAHHVNDDFSTVSDDFLDFSETNPFGDPENQ